MRYKKHFRFNYKECHYAYIISENEKCYLFISITHSKKTFKNSNIRLELPLKKNTKIPNYLIPMICIQEKRYFGRKISSMKFSKKDGSKLRLLYKKYNFKNDYVNY